MFVKTPRCARCALGRSHRSALLALGWGQQTMKQAITIKTDKGYDREILGATGETERPLGWPRASQRRLWEEVASPREA